MIRGNARANEIYDRLRADCCINQRSVIPAGLVPAKAGNGNPVFFREKAVLIEKGNPTWKDLYHEYG